MHKQSPPQPKSQQPQPKIQTHQHTNAQETQTTNISNPKIKILRSDIQIRKLDTGMNQSGKRDEREKLIGQREER